APRGCCAVKVSSASALHLAETTRLSRAEPASAGVFTLSLHGALPICLCEQATSICVTLEVCEIIVYQMPCVTHCLDRHGLINNRDRNSTRLNSSHVKISDTVSCLKQQNIILRRLDQSRRA